MKPRFAHKHTSAFIRPTSLGSAVKPPPVIEEVSIRRGSSKERVIVKNGTITEQSIQFRISDQVTFNAKVLGKGYFYATVNNRGHENLLFATPIIHHPSETNETAIVNYTLKPKN
jgi:hypothetical protein